MAIPKNLLPASLMEKPKTFEEFQDFFFYWEPALKENLYSAAKEIKLILWNARKIKKLTKSEIHRIYALYRGDNCFDDESNPRGYSFRKTAKEIKENENYIKYKGWKDSDNPKDPWHEGSGPLLDRE